MNFAARDITLGIIAGGRATRLGGMDKAWIERDGIPQVLRWRRRFEAEVAAILVSANRDLQRYRDVGLTAVADRIECDAGPIAALDALAVRCQTPWLVTVPVDLVGVNDCLLPTLFAERGNDGAVAVDDDGLQPLVALWRVEALRAVVAPLLSQGNFAVQQVQARLDMSRVVFAGVRFGNLNTPDDLAAAGITRPTP